MKQFKISAELFTDKELGGYSVYCPEFDVYSQGDTVKEALANIREAVEGYVLTVGVKKAREEYRKPLHRTMEIAV